MPGLKRARSAPSKIIEKIKPMPIPIQPRGTTAMNTRLMIVGKILIRNDLRMQVPKASQLSNVNTTPSSKDIKAVTSKMIRMPPNTIRPIDNGESVVSKNMFNSGLSKTVGYARL